MRNVWLLSYQCTSIIGALMLFFYGWCAYAVDQLSLLLGSKQSFGNVVAAQLDNTFIAGNSKGEFYLLLFFPSYAKHLLNIHQNQRSRISLPRTNSATSKLSASSTWQPRLLLWTCKPKAFLREVLDHPRFPNYCIYKCVMEVDSLVLCRHRLVVMGGGGMIGIDTLMLRTHFNAVDEARGSPTSH